MLIRQAHPGPQVPAYRSEERKRQDADRYRREEEIAWPVLIDDLAGTAHQAYGGLADPTYLIDVDGRVAFYCMWTHAPTLHEAIAELDARGGRGVVHGGIDHVPHMLSAMADGWRGIRRGLPQSVLDLMTAGPGMSSALWLGYRLRPLLAPVALRGKPLPGPAKAALGAGALALVLYGARRSWRHRSR